MMTFRCAGDLGDACYSLCIVKHYGGGIYYFEAAQYTRVALTEDKWKPVESLFRAQPYIQDVQQFTGQRIDVNLNDFRAIMFKTLRSGVGKDISLLQWMMRAHQVPLHAANDPWLTVDPKPVAKVVISRTGAERDPRFVYHNPRFPWHSVYQKYHKDAVFVGLPAEYALFTKVCADVPYYPTPDLLEAARVIAGAKLFVGNQSLCHAIAEGLKKDIVLEVWREGPNCLFHRPWVVHGWTEDTPLPDI